MMIKDVQNANRVEMSANDAPFQSPGDYVRFISPEVYRSNRQKYLRSYTFKSYDDEEILSAKKQRKWFKNKKVMNMKMKKTTESLGNSLKSCLRLLFSCFHV
ncbi:unnamed protein product [Arabidopsis lyrata]|uniref:Predicted protein n=1 Tax=Arabidopsis lyrata subsp. lyrata TaxID=81972 RepID=D7MMF2_ARALL|nr:uncharacterized protein LOC9302824 [Arabidopsis lyrata subsp. lyrata]EFH41316.1 predicted protein [Arabidopsis lyrata subsp. lyrata]CAH8281082.1 unnamed protein product [Arabidopsis lyrata]|eukprot:XP_002865057.1 uncharacterized protein LOC9302824 [Arabidopsis lyrata subsp. lyrata]